MEINELSDAIRQLKWVRYYYPDLREYCLIQPYIASNGEIDFHFYGYGSAWWNADRMFRKIFHEPHFFKIHPEATLDFGGCEIPADKINCLSETDAAEGLNICGYAGKWSKAKSAYDPDTHNYWNKVRQHFLELGGEYLHQQ